MLMFLLMSCHSIPSVEGVTGHAAKYFSDSQWRALTKAQLFYLSPHAASFIPIQSLMEDAEPVTNLREIRAAVGEDPKMVKMMEKMEIDGDGAGSSGVVFKPSIVIVILIAVIQYIRH